MARDVFVAGGIGVDHIVRVGQLPLPARDSVVVPPIHTYVAHPGNGVALGCAAMGLRTAILEVIGDDAEGDLVRRRYAASPVELIADVHESGTRRSVNLVAEDGARLSFYDPRHPNEYVPPGELWAAEVREARLVHASIVNWARHPLRDAVAAGTLTSTDLQDWDGENEHHREFALTADLVFLSSAHLADHPDDAAGGAADAAAHAIFADGRARVVVITHGARGSTIYPRGEAPVRVPPVTFPDRPVVDSNGAGDSYAAAFLARLLAGDGYAAAGRAGSIAGAWAAGSAGTHTAFLTPELLASIGAG
ncbi:carbohydrate kinase family protein [Xylanimonas sp. McL0601]|uniref:carbohydrate kinase family protein n=1 Tax=Xylanimonas sp. McL0601 TaxID=3414739 RepID=UPI003CF10AD2